jgi:hypothetical protein
MDFLGEITKKNKETTRINMPDVENYTKRRLR